jgi:hypothetical protein
LDTDANSATDTDTHSDADAKVGGPAIPTRPTLLSNPRIFQASRDNR